MAETLELETLVIKIMADAKQATRVFDDLKKGSADFVKDMSQTITPNIKASSVTASIDQMMAGFLAFKQEATKYIEVDASVEAFTDQLKNARQAYNRFAHRVEGKPLVMSLDTRAFDKSVSEAAVKYESIRELVAKPLPVPMISQDAFAHLRAYKDELRTYKDELRTYKEEMQSTSRSLTTASRKASAGIMSRPSVAAPPHEAAYEGLLYDDLMEAQDKRARHDRLSVMQVITRRITGRRSLSEEVLSAALPRPLSNTEITVSRGVGGLVKAAITAAGFALIPGSLTSKALVEAGVSGPLGLIPKFINTTRLIATQVATSIAVPIARLAAVPLAGVGAAAAFQAYNHPATQAAIGTLHLGAGTGAFTMPQAFQLAKEGLVRGLHVASDALKPITSGLKQFASSASQHFMSIPQVLSSVSEGFRVVLSAFTGLYPMFSLAYGAYSLWRSGLPQLLFKGARRAGGDAAAGFLYTDSRMEAAVDYFKRQWAKPFTQKVGEALRGIAAATEFVTRLPAGSIERAVTGVATGVKTVFNKVGSAISQVPSLVGKGLLYAPAYAADIAAMALAVPLAPFSKTADNALIKGTWGATRKLAASIWYNTQKIAFRNRTLTPDELTEGFYPNGVPERPISMSDFDEQKVKLTPEQQVMKSLKRRALQKAFQTHYGSTLQSEAERQVAQITGVERSEATSSPEGVMAHVLGYKPKSVERAEARAAVDATLANSAMEASNQFKVVASTVHTASTAIGGLAAVVKQASTGMAQASAAAHIPAGTLPMPSAARHTHDDVANLPASLEQAAGILRHQNELRLAKNERNRLRAAAKRAAAGLVGPPVPEDFTPPAPEVHLRSMGGSKIGEWFAGLWARRRQAMPAATPESSFSPVPPPVQGMAGGSGGGGMMRWLVGQELMHVGMQILRQSARAFIEYEETVTRSMVRIGGSSGVMKEQVTHDLMALARTGIQGPADLAKSFDVLTRSSFSARESMDLLGIAQQFATANGIPATEAAHDLSKAFIALGMRSADPLQNMESFTKLSDVLTKGASLANTSVSELAEGLSEKGAGSIRMLNLSLEDSVAYLLAFSEAGLKGASASQALAQTYRSIQHSATHADTRGKWATLGVDVFDSAGKMLPLDNIVRQMSTRLRSGTDQEKANVLEGLNLDSGKGGIKTLMDSSGDVERFRNELKETTGFMKEMASIMGGTFTAQFKNLIVNVEVIATQIGNILAPALMLINDTLSGALRWWNSLNDKVKTGILTFALAGVAVYLLSGYVISLGVGFAKLALSLVALPFQVVWRLAEGVWDLVSGFGMLIFNVVKFIATGIQMTFLGLYKITFDIVNTLNSMALGLLNIGMSIGSALAALAPFLLGLTGIALLVGGLSGPTFQNMFAGLKEGGVEAFNAVGEKAGNVFNNLKDNGAEMWDAVTGGAHDFVEKGIGFFMNFQENMDTILKWAKENWRDILTDVLSFVQKFSKNLMHNIQTALPMVGKLLKYYLLDFWIDAMPEMLKKAKGFMLDFAKDAVKAVGDAVTKGVTGQDPADLIFEKEHTEYMKIAHKGMNNDLAQIEKHQANIAENEKLIEGLKLYGARDDKGNLTPKNLALLTEYRGEIQASKSTIKMGGEMYRTHSSEYEKEKDILDKFQKTGQNWLDPKMKSPEEVVGGTGFRSLLEGWEPITKAIAGLNFSMGGGVGGLPADGIGKRVQEAAAAAAAGAMGPAAPLPDLMGHYQSSNYKEMQLSRFKLEGPGGLAGEDQQAQTVKAPGIEKKLDEVKIAIVAALAAIGLG